MIELLPKKYWTIKCVFPFLFRQIDHAHFFHAGVILIIDVFLIDSDINGPNDFSGKKRDSLENHDTPHPQ